MRDRPRPLTEATHAGHQMGKSSERPVLEREIARNASGTAWQPDDTPHTALHASAAGWDLMFHTLLFGGYDYQATDRGSDTPVAIGWVMGMARRRLGFGADVTGRVMLSPEPWTVRDGGYPLLLQTGETYQGEPLRDRQHPHELFMELGGLYTQALTPGFGFQIYAAAAGEPALGPVAFPHRVSSSPDPLAALGHHWQDSTHISFGVLTAGLLTRVAKLEGSWFNGREPDETRYDLDLRSPDSFAARLSVAPFSSTVGQISYGYLASPEVLRPDEEVHRVTASVTHHRGMRAKGLWASTAAFGLNREGQEDATSSLLLETALDLDGRNVIFGRGELVQKTGHDLVLTPDLEEERFWLGALALGYVRNLGEFGSWMPGVGVRGSVNFVPEALRGFYGTRTPVGGMVYLRLALAPMRQMAH